MAKAGAVKSRVASSATRKARAKKSAPATKSKLAKSAKPSKPRPKKLSQTKVTVADDAAASKSKTKKTPARGANGRFAKTGPPSDPAKGQTPRSLILKIYGTIDGELTKLEKQKGSTSQDRERASRALSQITSSLERASDMQRELAKASARGARKTETEALRHAEDMRRQIAERIERLGQDPRFAKPAG